MSAFLVTKPSQSKAPISLMLLIFLTACKEEKPSSVPVAKDSKKTETIAEDLHSFKVIAPPAPASAPVEELPEEPEEIDLPEPIKFPDPQPLLRESRVRQLRGLRQWQSHQKVIVPPSSKENRKYRISDPDYQQWDTRVGEDKSTYPVDRSRILTADMRISAVLEDSINSQLPGRIIAVVDRDIPSPNGKYILLPSYTKIICHYQSLEKEGNTRLMVSCSRAIRPDGVSIVLTEAMSADQMGRIGMIGDVDNRVPQKYGAAFAIASLSALSQAGSNVSSNQTLGSSANVLSQNLAQVTSKLLDQYLSIAPVVTIAAGSRVQIIPFNDIHLRAPVLEGEVSEIKAQENQQEALKKQVPASEPLESPLMPATVKEAQGIKG